MVENLQATSIFIGKEMAKQYERTLNTPAFTQTFTVCSVTRVSARYPVTQTLPPFHSSLNSDLFLVFIVHMQGLSLRVKFWWTGIYVLYFHLVMWRMFF